MNKLKMYKEFLVILGFLIQLYMLYDLNRSYYLLKAELKSKFLEQMAKVEGICSDSNLKMQEGLNNIKPHLDGFKLEASSNLAKLQELLFKNYQHPPIIVPGGADNFLSGFFFCIKMVFVIVLVFYFVRSFSFIRTFISSILGGGFLGTLKVWSLTSGFAFLKKLFGFCDRGHPGGEGGGASSSESFSNVSLGNIVPETSVVLSTTSNGSFDTITSINTSEYNVSTSSLVIMVPGIPRVEPVVQFNPLQIPKGFVLSDSGSVDSSLPESTDFFPWKEL